MNTTPFRHRLLGLLAVGATVLLTGAPAAQAQAQAPGAAEVPAQPEKARLGIAEPNLAPGVAEQAAADGASAQLRQLVGAFDGQLIDAFNKTRKFQVVGRSDLDAILKEQDFAASGQVDASDEQAARMFEVAGCKYMVRVTIDSFQDRRESLRLENRGELLTKRVVTVGAVVKIYDTTTAALYDSYNDLIQMQEVDEGDLAVQVSGDRLSTKLREAADAFSQRAADYVAGTVFPAKVAAVQSGVLFINRGEGSGISPGQVWTVYAVQGGITDPDTGELLGQVELPLADVKITRVLPRLSQAQALDGSDPGFEAGMIVRPSLEEAASTPAAAPAPTPAPTAAAATPAPAEPAAADAEVDVAVD